ncbi:Rieske (2Fe-2S) protein [Methylacidiphilum caldifontis]|uniref:Rieske (2Fe-2S) protein n=1 Tax=Methylacidiphilum caldifontis TaxID=2795386 RepID=UPI001A904A14|nr:Rieske (2Fe-2S) protein [Methylacidiphilum caldifontis]QSR88963.1 Rieske (2Fe-2S) protein [Methylacidiphilum caldifontis]
MKSNGQIPKKGFPLCPLNELVPCVGRTFKLGELKISLFKTRSDKTVAVQALCPHRGGPLSEALCDEQVLICPLHGYSFSLETGNCTISDKYQLKTYPTFVINGWIYLDLSTSPNLFLSNDQS